MFTQRLENITTAYLKIKLNAWLTVKEIMLHSNSSLTLKNESGLQSHHVEVTSVTMDTMGGSEAKVLAISKIIKDK